MKSRIASASVSISKLSAYGSLLTVLSTNLRTLVAPEVDPVRVSPRENEPETEEISSTLVVEFHDLTLAVTPVVDPVMISLNSKSPLEVEDGSEIVISGGSMYLFPLSVMLILAIVPAAPITDSAVALATPTT